MKSARFIVFSYLYLVKAQFCVLQINSKKFTSGKNKQAKKKLPAADYVRSVNDKKLQRQQYLCSKTCAATVTVARQV